MRGWRRSRRALLALPGVLVACESAAVDTAPLGDTADTASEVDTGPYDPPYLGGCVDAPAGPVVLESSAEGRYVGDGGFAVSDPDADGCPAVLVSGRATSVDPGHAATYLHGPPEVSGGLEASAAAVISLADSDGDFAYSVGVLDGGRTLVLPGVRVTGTVLLFDAAGVTGAVTEGAAWGMIPVEAEEGTGRFGYALATGDADGDGTEDLLVSDLEVWEDPNYTTRVWLVHDVLGVAAVEGKVTSAERLLARVPDDAENFGASLALADLDGDGLHDAIVGDTAPNAEEWGTLQRVLVWPGPVDVLPAGKTPTVVGSGSLAGGSRFGWSLATGDVDADGYGDLAVGAIYLDVGGQPAGGVFVFRGPLADVTADDADTLIEGVAERYGGAGEAIALASSDPEGSPLDLVTGATGVLEYAGAVYRVPAPFPPRVSLDESYEIARGGEYQGLGKGVANLGDVDGDGIDDIVASAAPYDDYGALWFLYSSALVR